MAAIAIKMAADAVLASMPVIKRLSFVRPESAIGGPLSRQIPARHFPVSRSNAWTINRLYSTADLRRTDVPMGAYRGKLPRVKRLPFWKFTSKQFRQFHCLPLLQWS
jgi:hypothetical protein